ncbi:MAG: HIT domain-containing protein [Anaerolineae bacterium]|nr:HIT domain-containing protein [Anaerolineae bacterium]
MSNQTDCIFCQIVVGSVKSWPVYESEHAYAFFDINPVNEYHTLVIPKRHFTNLFDVPVAELAHVMAAVKHVTDLLHAKAGIENIQIINSSGVAAQQDVFHLHFHVIPRHRGDGQNIGWAVRPGISARFDDLLQRLQ